MKGFGVNYIKQVYHMTVHHKLKSIISYLLVVLVFKIYSC